MKMIKMHQNAVICIRMRMLKNNTTFVKKQHLSRTAHGRCVSTKPLSVTDRREARQMNGLQEQA
jgi:hypothetical protein